MNNLLHCPFCGSKPVLSMVEGDPPDEYPDEYFVECLNCMFLFMVKPMMKLFKNGTRDISRQNTM